uniref:Eukaryotic translation initiation factor 4E n=1 Tax=viral metagenome TaxID=1070528 RepID=A0A6C0KB56_9ZZZZ
MDNQEHPLQDKWVLWEHRVGSDEESYTSNLSQIGNFSTVEGFFSYVKNMPWPSSWFYTRDEKRLRLGGRDVVGFSCFKEGIQPCWEDPQNIDGGEWRIRKFNSLQYVDDAWKFCALMCIGNNYPEGLNITGCRVVDSSNSSKGRAMYNVEVWFSDTDDYDQVRNMISEATGTVCSRMFYRRHSEDNENKEIKVDNTKAPNKHYSKNGRRPHKPRKAH